MTREWISRTRARWAAARAAASVAGGDGGAWLDGPGAAGFACDAAITPVVTGEVDPGVLPDLVRLSLELAGYGPGRQAGRTDSAGRTDRADGADGAEIAGPRPPTGRGRAALEQAIIGKAIGLLSEPGGLASHLRRRLPGARLAGPSLPLDVGWSEDIPAAIRNAVRIRDQHCRFPADASPKHTIIGRARCRLHVRCPRGNVFTPQTLSRRLCRPLTNLP